MAVPEPGEHERNHPANVRIWGMEAENGMADPRFGIPESRFESSYPWFPVRTRDLRRRISGSDISAIWNLGIPNLESNPMERTSPHHGAAPAGIPIRRRLRRAWWPAAHAVADRRSGRGAGQGEDLAGQDRLPRGLGERGQLDLRLLGPGRLGPAGADLAEVEFGRRRVAGPLVVLAVLKVISACWSVIRSRVW